ncbi:MAG: hypothetical protein AB7K68_08065 [Bacteriovoracia bacterium]
MPLVIASILAALFSISSAQAFEENGADASARSPGYLSAPDLPVAVPAETEVRAEDLKTFQDSRDTQSKEE